VFVPGRYFKPSEIFASEGTTLVKKHPKGATLWQAPALLTNIILVRKGSPKTNTLAY
jgi:hypothetical protein